VAVGLEICSEGVRRKEAVALFSTRFGGGGVGRGGLFRIRLG